MWVEVSMMALQTALGGTRNIKKIKHRTQPPLAAQLIAAISPLELEQTHTAQKPLLWVEVGAHAVLKRPGRGGVGWDYSTTQQHHPQSLCCMGGCGSSSKARPKKRKKA